MHMSNALTFWIMTLYKGTVTNQLFRRTFRNSIFFGTRVHLGTLTFQKNLNHKNFLEKLDLRQCYKKLIHKILTTFLLISLAACRLPDSFGFYQPITMRLKTPDGPPAYKAGWYGGCKSGLAVRGFANSVVYQEGKGPEFVNGIYMHDPDYQTGWGQGWFICTMHSGYFAGSAGFYGYGPLE
jgi:hypothetical protein